MNYAVIYSSRTGNTRLLAETVRESMAEGNCVYFGETSGIDDQVLREAQLFFVGFWTDKGSCDASAAEVLKKMDYKDVFLFGTAGFGGAPAYFDQILSRAEKNLPSTARIAGTYMCQGKMPVAVRERYMKMKEEGNASAQIDSMIENFDRAMSHPDQQDMEKLKETVHESLQKQSE